MDALLSEAAVRRVVAAALAEDAPWGDVTGALFLPPGARCRLAVRFREPGVLCGLAVAREVFAQADAGAVWEALASDGDALAAGAVAAVVEGDAAGLLAAERVALNFLQRLSGVATLTAAYVRAAAAGGPARIVDTRKTTPGLRELERYAVRTGGGRNHRQGLSDGILVKDNHLAVLRAAGVPLGEAVRRATAQAPHLYRVEVEVETLAEVREALDAGADVLLLDNMAPDALAEAVRLCAGRAVTEASGGVSLETVAAVAASGVDCISVGALTHSAPALDIALDAEAGPARVQDAADG